MGKKQRDDAEELDEDGWEIENERPEDIYENPADYWTAEAIAKLLKAKGQARIQYKLATRAINGIGEQFPDFFEQESECPLALDLGCGVGFTSDILVEAGFTAIGIDVLVDMLAMSGTREIVTMNAKRARYHRALASATALPFRGTTFEFEASISALQWLSTSKALQVLSTELARTCKAGACITIQQYSHSSDEVVALGSAMKREGFDGGILVDNPKSARRRRVFLLVRKK
jgi:SAM-dependent methyltransferase